MKKTLKIEAVENLINELDLTRQCRLNDYLYPRSILYYNIRKYEGWSLQRIAELLKVNHATVINGIKKYENLVNHIKQYPDFLIVKNQIEAKIFDIEIEESDNVVFEQSLIEKVMSCNNYFEMRLLQEELKKTMV
jgi:predicted DNA-binding protein YlxM (UPF0122 family)